MASGPGPSRGRGLRGLGARGRGRSSVRPGPGHVRVRTLPPLPPSQSRPGPPRTMGSILSRRIAGVEDIDIQANSAYRYPPKSGERGPRPRARTARRGPERGSGGGRGDGAARAGPSAEGGQGICSARGPPSRLSARSSARPPPGPRGVDGAAG